MRTPGSRPAVGRRQIVADKSGKRGITSAHQRSRPSFSSLSIPPVRSIVSPRLVSLLFLFPPPSLRFLPFPSDASSSRRKLSPLFRTSRREERVGRWFTVSSLFPSPLYTRRSSPGPSLRRPTCKIFRAGFAGVYIRRKRTTGARLACLFLPSFARLPACLFVKSKQRAVATTCHGVPTRHRCTASSPGLWLNR